MKCSLVFNAYCTSSPSKPPKNTATSIASDILAAQIQELEKKGENKLPNEEEQQKDEEQQRKDKENQKRATKFGMIFIGAMIALGGGNLILQFGPPPTDEEGNVVEDRFSDLPIVEQYFKRAYTEMKVWNKMIQAPSRDKLLPDPLSHPYIQPRYTLLIELRDVLLHPEWSLQNGWRFKKRPGVDFLLRHCAPPLFEIVIICNESPIVLAHIIDKLDPEGMAWYRLYKDSMNYVDGKHYKELNSLNRDLKRVILVDHNPESSSCPRNHLTIPRWDGKTKDGFLMQLGLMLRTISESEIDDVREVLDFYREFEDPVAKFGQLKRELEEEDLRREEERKNNTAPVAKNWTPSLLSKWF